MGYDHPPRSFNPCGAPDDVADAVRAGFARNITDFDLRDCEWRDDAN